MTHLFADFEISNLVKEKGFDANCLAVYMNGEFQIPRGFSMAIVTKSQVDLLKGKALLAPLWDQIIEWLREVHNIDIVIENGGKPKMYAIFVAGNWIYENQKDRILYSYTDARRVAILHALTII